ncbi:MAG: OmpA family protein [Candidatus Omnitrophica bacterium]|nr:OmpA family protein [Candidatus Omnitrophota bacterium]
MRRFLCAFLLLALPLVSGCATLSNILRANQLARQNRRLHYELKNLKSATRSQISELEQAMQDLAAQLGEYQAKLEITERGLVITFLSEIFFDSGQAEIREQGKEALEKVAAVLQRDVPGAFIAIEGHTDNVPIRHSGWATNWELASARALAVLHYLIATGELDADRLSANSYGEFRPVAGNDTPEGRQKNRRVEIIIVPATVKKEGTVNG